MKYKNVTDEEWKGFDITIYEMLDDTYTVDAKKPCGELVQRWEGVKSFNCAMVRAVEVIEDYGAASQEGR